MYEDLQGPEIGETVIDNTGLEETSSQIGKTVEEKMDEAIKTNVENEEQTREVSANQNNKEETKKNETQVNTTEETKEQNTKSKDPSFVKPVEGEMMKEFAKDRLVYSETLKEWTGHLGVDIKAEKTTVVKAAEGRKSYSYKE